MLHSCMCCSKPWYFIINDVYSALSFAKLFLDASMLSDETCISLILELGLERLENLTMGSRVQWRRTTERNVVDILKMTGDSL